MDTSAAKEICAAKTDLNLLLECLKYQMNCPDSQKQTLLTICSICQQKEEIFDYFQEMGGVRFVYNLSQSSKHCDVKEAALFILGGLAECYVFCQQALCRADIFTDLAHLFDEDLQLSLKTMAAYMLSALVASNRLGQTLARQSGCITVLLRLFSTSFPNTSNCLEPETTSVLYQLWVSVSSALCGCVNNPQNEENQRMCVSIFPMMKLWLQDFGQSRRDIVQPVCSFITMTVASQSIAQESFASVGGLSVLAQCVAKLVPESGTDPSAFKTAITITRALCACVGDNAPLAASLAQYQLVAHLLMLLSCPSLHKADQLCIVLMLGHCTEASEAHQRQLLQRGGLSKMISLLAESLDEELKRAVTFVLHNCEQMTNTLGAGSESSPSQDDTNDSCQSQQHFAPYCNMESYLSFSKEMLQRINQLERALARDLQGGVDEQKRNPENSADKWQDPVQCKVVRDIGEGDLLPLSAPVNFSSELWEGTPSRIVRGWPKRKSQEKTVGSVNKYELTQAMPVPLETGQIGESHRIPGQCDVHSVREEIFQTTTVLSKVMSTCGEQEGAGIGHLLQESHCARCTSHAMTLQDTQAARVPDISNTKSTQAPVRQTFNKPPATLKRRAENEKRQHNVKGCAGGLSPVNSRNFPQVLRSCQHKCERHMVLMEVEDRFKRAIRKVIREERGASKDCRYHSLTPLHKGDSPKNFHTKDMNMNPQWITWTPIKKPLNTEGSKPYQREEASGKKRQESKREDIPKSRVIPRRERKNFTQEEVQYLLDGVRRLGPSWNCILWSYPFQIGRTNVDLAKKYNRLKKADMRTVHPSSLVQD